MKRSLPEKILSVAIVVSAFVGPLSSMVQAEDGQAYLLTTSNRLELVGFPVHQPAVDSGIVSSVSGVAIGWSPSFQGTPFGTSLPTGEEYYAEVVGPSTHPWLGQRFELDEVATRTRSDNGLVVANSPLNTLGMPDQTLAGAELEVRRHLTIDGLWGESVRNRMLFGGEKASTFSFSINAPESVGGVRTIYPILDQTGNLSWSNSDLPILQTPPTRIISPGTSVGIAFGNRRGSSLGLTGFKRTWPTATPLQAGVNLLSYPYSSDLRLGIDWGTPADGFKGLANPLPTQDRVEIGEGAARRCYAPELQSNSSLRWRLLDPSYTSKRWATPPSYLDRIPVGQGFILRKNKSASKHFFRPPQP
ncbi:MAG: hypothetical protein ACEQSM_03930 [Aliarcobacter sp.]